MPGAVIMESLSKQYRPDRPGELSIGLTMAGFGLFLGLVPCSLAETYHDPGFASELVTTLPAFGPVGVAWAPDGRMFIWQKNGIVSIFKNGSLLPTPFLNFSAKVNTYNDNGMWGLAFDPDFANNRYVYLTYVYEPNGNPNDTSPKISRLVRVTADQANTDVMLSGSEVALIDNAPDDAATHALGTIRFARDGTLFVGNGDGASPSFADPNAFGAQDLDSMRGKFFRINPDGTAPTNNPFYDGTNSVRSRVWCYGVRNPYRFSLHPATGVPYFGDLGWNTWEEVDRGVAGGNFGWPCYEGNGTQPQYQSILPQCASIGSVIPPLITYDHTHGDLNEGGTCVVGGDFYTATQYPQAYQGNYFYADYSGNWIHRAVLDANGNLLNTVSFATGLSVPVCVEQGPDGLLYYVAFSTGEIRRIRYNGPVAVASASPAYGYSPLTVSLSSAGSTNSGGGALTYLWDCGDGTNSSLPNPSHTYTASGVTIFNAKLTLTTSLGQSSFATTKITVGSLPPTPTIVTPADGTGFMPGQTVFYQGSASDPDDGPLPPSALAWTVLLHHNTHVHTVVVGVTGSQGTVVIADHGTIGTFSYEIVLTATDSSGLATSTSVQIPVIADTSPPTIPSNVAATAGMGQINLSWDASTDNAAVAGYLVERQGGGITTFTQVGTSTGTTFNDTGLAENTTYSYRVRAEDASGNLSDYSAVASATTPSGPSGLVAAYAFGEGTGTTVGDASGNGNNGTISGATWTASGKYGNALAFNGTSARVTINDATSLDLTTGMTLEAWVNPSAVSSAWRDVIYKGNDNYYLEGTSETSGRPGMGGTFSLSPVYGTVALTANTWTHLAATYDGTTMRLYVNGVQVASRAQTGSIATSTNPLQIGGDSIYGQYFRGTIDEVRVYNRALGTAEIQADMNTPIP